MDDVTSIRIPQDNVNDDRVLILEWRVDDGAPVTADQVLVEVETSKSVFEITAPHGGVLRILKPSNQEIPVGDILCVVGPDLETIDRVRNGSAVKTHDLPPSPATPPASAETSAPPPLPVASRTVPSKTNGLAPTPRSTRFSRRALEILQQRGLSPEAFTGRGLLRVRDLEPGPAPVSIQPPPPAVEEAVPTPAGGSNGSSAHPAARSASGVPFRAEPLPRIKRVESRLLAWSTEQAIRSSVTVLVPTAGRDRLEAVDLEAPETRTAFLIQACGALLRQYPLLNACCLGAEIRRYEQVNIGYAIDGGKGLKVPVLREVDTRTLTAITAERRRFVTEYLAETLRPAEFAGGTFTITDLSGAGVVTCDPLLSEGQGGILGIGAEFGPADGALAQHLVLAFDHRLIEGRMAAAFLNDLKSRLVEYERGLLSGTGGQAPAGPADEPICSRCGMTVSNASRRNHFLVSVSVAGPRAGATALVCTVCLRGR